MSWEYESSEGGVSLRWRPPQDMGGRSEVWYGVVCRICPSATQSPTAMCSWCGETVTYTPVQTGLRQTKVTLNNLLTRVTYLIQVQQLHLPWAISVCQFWVDDSGLCSSLMYAICLDLNLSQQTENPHRMFRKRMCILFLYSVSARSRVRVCQLRALLSIIKSHSFVVRA